MLSRRIFDHPYWQESRPFSKFEAWIDLLQMAAFAPTERVIGFQTIALDKGELVASLRFLAQRWGWSKDKVARFVRCLEIATMVRREERQGQAIITICKYKDYNDSTENSETPSETQSATRSRHDRDKCNKIKNKTKDKLYPSGAGGSVSQKKKAKVEANTPEMETIGSWFGRKPETLWSVYEAEALRDLNPTPDEIESMGRYYAAKIQAKDDFRRRDVGTLLNNWTGELDRANRFTATSGDEIKTRISEFKW